MTIEPALQAHAELAIAMTTRAFEQLLGGSLDAAAAALRQGELSFTGDSALFSNLGRFTAPLA